MAAERTLNSDFVIPAPLAEVFPFFADAGNLETITPPWLNFRILTPMPIVMAAGALIDYRIKVRGVAVSWRTRISAWEPPYRFVDEQIRGPYVLWHHEHRFEETTLNGRAATRAIDIVRYKVPGWIVEPIVHRLFVRGDLERIFEFRRVKMLELFTPGNAAHGTVRPPVTDPRTTDPRTADPRTADPRPADPREGERLVAGHSAAATIAR
ncbi:MAG: SRPBCC family protein [Planctomycetota bacterium]|nr:SRPBCC family protein [Planctomycetota bacterium]